MSEPASDDEDVEDDFGDADAPEVDAGIRAYPAWLRFLRWSFALFIIVGALLLPVFLLGVRLHVHPWTGWRGTEAPEVAGLRVRVSAGLDVPDRTQLEIGGAGLLHSPRSFAVDVEASELEDGGMRLDMRFPENDIAGWELHLELEQGGATVTRATAYARRGADGSPEELTGTLLVSTLDWRAPGAKSCVFALHAEEMGLLCFRGSFLLER